MGRRSIYVDLVDYDEVAHHAGCNRIEALRVLESLDQVLRVLESLTEGCAQALPLRHRLGPRPVTGSPLRGSLRPLARRPVPDFTREDVLSLEENVESWGRVESVFDDLAGDDSIGHQTAARAATRMQARSAPDEAASTSGELVVLGSGNLGLVYAREPVRLSHEDIDARWPRLLPGLAATPGIGFVAVLSREHGNLSSSARTDTAASTTASSPAWIPGAVRRARVLGPAAGDARCPRRRTSTSTARWTRRRSRSLPSRAWSGSHGGLGGWQDRGLLIAPTHLLEAGAEEIRGAEELHLALVSMLVTLGHRSDLPQPVGSAHP